MMYVYFDTVSMILSEYLIPSVNALRTLDELRPPLISIMMCLAQRTLSIHEEVLVISNLGRKSGVVD